ncbi:ATP-binding cassette domain-containing protein [Streptomyces sp. NPDC090445]|uniref:ATP-binding cassette domain-containing protein n=1 Tax=Streptomyces sp. NPDC090445 TaxID=3365963 RepID=UPI003809B058
MDSPHGAAVKAENFGLKGPRGWAFRGVGIDAGPGSLIAVEGPSGTGRTCLLLALTGRMKPSEGHAEVAGHPLPKRMAAVRRVAALGPVSGVNDLDQALTVAEQLREGALLQRRYEGPVRALLRPRGERRTATAARIDAALAAAGLDVDALPKGPRTSVRDLDRLEAVRLSVAIALLGSPRLLALDDLDIKLSDAERADAWAMLRSIADAGTTVLAVCSQAPDGVQVLRTSPAEPETKLAAKPASKVETKTAAKPADKTEAKPAAKPETKPARKDTAKPAAMDTGTAETEPAAKARAEGEAQTDAQTEAKPAAQTEARTEAKTPADTADDDTKGADDALAEAGRA